MLEDTGKSKKFYVRGIGKREKNMFG